jgi:hypothetical protein
VLWECLKVDILYRHVLQDPPFTLGLTTSFFSLPHSSEDPLFWHALNTLWQIPEVLKEACYNKNFGLLPLFLMS